MNKKSKAHLQRAIDIVTSGKTSPGLCRTSEQLGKGQYGTTFACAGDKTRVVKLVTCPAEKNPKEWKAEMMNEILIQELAGSIDIAPKVYAHKQKGLEFLIEMDRCSKPIYNSKSAEELVELIETMVENQIVHNDLHQGNIMRLRGKTTIIDFGLATLLPKLPTLDESNMLQAMHIAQLVEQYADDNNENYVSKSGAVFKGFIHTLEDRFVELMGKYKTFNGLKPSDHSEIAAEINAMFPKSTSYVKLQCFGAVHARLSHLYLTKKYSDVSYIYTESKKTANEDVFWAIRQLTKYNKSCADVLWKFLLKGSALSTKCKGLLPSK